MPHYDYQCDSCDHKTIIFQKMSDKPYKNCPNCSKESFRRLIGPGAVIIFKGSGFYCTDYKDKPKVGGK